MHAPGDDGIKWIKPASETRMCFLSFVGPDIMDMWYPTCTDDMKVEVNKSGEEREPVGKRKEECGGYLWKYVWRTQIFS